MLCLQSYNSVSGSTATEVRVYIYLGTFRVINDIAQPVPRKYSDYKTMYLYASSTYSSYMNVETGKISNVSILNRDDFEDLYNIIFLTKTNNKTCANYTFLAEQIRLWYLEQLLTTSEDLIIRKLEKPRSIKQIIGKRTKKLDK